MSARASMTAMLAGALLFGSGAAAQVPEPRAAQNESEQSFPLKNGTTVRGVLLRQEPGRFLVIRTRDGWTVTIPWQHVGAPEEKPAVGTGPAASPAAGPAPDTGPELETGFRLGARAGLAFPFGDLETDDAVSDVFGTSLPLTLDVGVQLTRGFYLGVYGTYAFTGAGDSASLLCSQQSCTAYGARIGLALEGRIAATYGTAPWVGYSVGWSADEIDVDTPEGTRQYAWGGIDVAHVLGGVDFRVSDTLMVGPFGGAAFGLYLYKVDALEGTGDNDHTDGPELHGWIHLGARGTFLP